METENLNEEGESIEEYSSYQKKGGHTVLKVLLGIILGLSIGFFAGVLLTSSAGINSNKSSTEVLKEISGTSDGQGNTKLGYIIALIKGYYYKDVEDQTLVDGIYKGLVASLDDPYSGYYTAQEYEDLMVSLTGDYAGIGALLSKAKDTGVVTVSKVYAGTPAEASGLQNGDIIVAADGFNAVELELDDFVQHVRGEAGTDVVLDIIRDDEEMQVTCTRAKVSTPTVEYQMLEGNVGYIQISQFTNNTYEDFVAAMETLKGDGMESVVFDLRSNGGGLLDSVVDILDYLLPEGVVVYTMDKNGNREDYTSDGANYINMPITVLVDGNTASAAEIFTGAIRDFNYGTIIGTKTFGKGIVQSTIPLSDGSALKLTTNSYYTPSGECIHGVGISPDIELEYEFLGGEDEVYSIQYDNQLQKALEVLAQ